MPTNNDIALVVRTLQVAGYSAAATPDRLLSRSIRLRYRNNPDGSIRWLWQAGAGKPGCLRFYHAGTPKAWVATIIIRLLFTCRLEKLFSNGTLRVYTDTESLESIKNNWGADFSIFTGTTGPNRKSLVWFRTKGKGYFIKIATNPTAADIVSHELSVLEELRDRRFYFIRLPKFWKSSTSTLELEDLGQENRDRYISSLSRVHELALYELYRHTGRSMPIGRTSWWEHTERCLARLRKTSDHRLPHGMIRKIDYLAARIDPQQIVRCCRAHGDFTPWNMVSEGNRLAVYDWELSMADAPVLWDAFHYIFQSGVMLHKQPPQLIRKNMIDLNESELYRLIGGSEANDFNLLFQLYLLTNISYYLELYSRQPRWHIQVSWQIRAWNEILNEIMQEKGVLAQRQLLCMDLFDQLQDQSYAALKWTSRNAEHLSILSDIDLCVDPMAVPVLDHFLSRHPLTDSLRRHQRTFMNTYTVLLKDGSLLSIDAIWQFKRKELEFMETKEMLADVGFDARGVKVPGPKAELEYVRLFYLLNRAPVPPKYQDRFLNSVSGTDSPRDEVIADLLKLPANRGWRRITNCVFYYIDTIRSVFRRDGLLITFSGVDGAGKSTVIENIRHQLQKQFRREVVVLRHRPSLLPILSSWRHGKVVAEQNAAMSLPRQGNNYSRLSSLLRFAYYYSDYLLGQFYIQVKYIWRGYIVLYDRYYFDFINDSRRSNIQLPPAFTAWFYRFLIKPHLNFFLYASPEEILQRKQELGAATIRDLTGRYLELFTTLSQRYHRSKYIPIHNNNLGSTLEQIVQHIKRSA